MKKGEFLARLRPAVLEALGGSEGAAQARPMAEAWLDRLAGQDAAAVDRAVAQLAADGPPPATAEEAITAVAARVRRAAEDYARTGEMPELPGGLGLPGASGLLGGLGGLGGVLFKARPGGARDPGDPRALQRRLGAGQPLEGGLRARMEAAFGRSFAGVRVHAGGDAAGLTSRLNARAFTVGEHVAFGAREYRPGTLAGDALVAHELAHVAQQESGGRNLPARGGSSYAELERDADRAAAGAVASVGFGGRLRLAATRLVSGPRLQRCCCGRTTHKAEPPNGFCDECDRQYGWDWACCTPHMQAEIAGYRSKADADVGRAVDALQPANLPGHAAQLQAHFHLAPGDAAVDTVRQQFARMKTALSGGQVQFFCRASGDDVPGCRNRRISARSTNCSNAMSSMLCGRYDQVKDPATDDFLDPRYEHTMVHEFAHMACKESLIRAEGSEVYYRGAFPGTAAEAVHQADCYANFALAVR